MAYLYVLWEQCWMAWRWQGEIMDWNNVEHLPEMDTHTDACCGSGAGHSCFSNRSAVGNTRNNRTGSCIRSGYAAPGIPSPLQELSSS